MFVLTTIGADLGDLQPWLRAVSLVGPVVIAVLLVRCARDHRPSSARPRSAAVEFDRERLGDRRYTSNRIWFSAFVSQLAAAEGLETHVDEALDLELVSIQQSMLKASQGSPSAVDVRRRPGCPRMADRPLPP